MATEEERCAEAKKFKRIDDAFHEGDLEALRAAVDDPAVIPNGRMPDTVGPCLVYAIYHSPLAFIRTLLEIGADPNAPVDDGFPPLIAALISARDVPGSKRRTDVDEIIRLLLSFGVDPNQRGINDYTPLHMAVAERNLLAIQHSSRRRSRSRTAHTDRRLRDTARDGGGGRTDRSSLPRWRERVLEFASGCDRD